MDLKLHDRDFKKIQINKNRHFYLSIYPYKYSDELRRHKIICHSYFVDRLKIYDLESVLKEYQITAIEEFIKENPEYDYGNTVFYTLMELTKGISFSPDLKTFKLFYQTKFGIEQSKGIVMGQILGLIPKFYTKLMNIISRSFFGLDKGLAYDYADTYEEIMSKIDKFDKIIRKEDLPEFVKGEII